MKEEIKNKLVLLGAFAAPILFGALGIVFAFRARAEAFKSIEVKISPTSYMAEVKEAVCGANSCRVRLENGRYTTVSRLVLVGEKLCQFRKSINGHEPAELIWQSCAGDE